MTVIRPNSISGVSSITGQGGDISIFRADGTAADVTVNNITSGVVTATTFSGAVTGSGANLTNLPAANLTGTLPAISGANLTGINTAFGNSSVNTSGIITATAFVPTTQGSLSHRNLIINGAMQVAQRGTSLSAVQNSFTLDRFKFKRESTAANFNMAQSTTSPDGFAKSLKMTCTAADTSTASNEFVMVRYNIEAQDLQSLGYGTASAKPLVLSFYVRSSLTGVYGVNCLQIDNSNKIYSRTYTINSANTWEKKTISIPADTSGVINDDNGVGLQINFALVIGSSYKGSAVSSAYESYANDKFASQHGVNFASSTSNDWYLTGVQLEVGSVATPFEHRSYQDEIKRCMRYFQKIFNTQIIFSKNTNERFRLSAAFMEPMRGTPSYTRTSNNLDAQNVASTLSSSDTTEAQGGNTATADGLSYSRQWDFGGFSNIPNRSMGGASGNHVFNLDSEL